MTRPMTPPEGAPAGPQTLETGARPGGVVARAVIGVLLVLAGSLTLSGLIWMSNSGSDVAEKLLFDLGLALTSLISALAQALVFYGLWLLWKRPTGSGEAIKVEAIFAARVSNHRRAAAPR